MASKHPVLARMLAANAQWATDVEQVEPGFFENGTKGQSPKVLWIGCADSRVPESVVMACKPGEIFVHRNIAKYVYPVVLSPSSLARAVTTNSRPASILPSMVLNDVLPPAPQPVPPA